MVLKKNGTLKTIRTTVHSFAPFHAKVNLPADGQMQNVRILNSLFDAGYTIRTNGIFALYIIKRPHRDATAGEGQS